MCFSVSSVRWQRLPAFSERACFGMARRGCPHLVDGKKTFCSCLCEPLGPCRGLFLNGGLSTKTFWRRSQKTNLKDIVFNRVRFLTNYSPYSSQLRKAFFTAAIGLSNTTLLAGNTFQPRHMVAAYMVAAFTDKPLNDQVRSQDSRSILEISWTVVHLPGYYPQVTQPQRSKLFEPQSTFSKCVTTFNGLWSRDPPLLDDTPE